MITGRRRREVEGYLYSRKRGTNGRVIYYGDFRGFESAGGGREALIPPGRSRATSDKEEALLLADARLIKLQKLERLTKPNTQDRRTLGVLGPEWMIHRAKVRATSEQWMKDCERHLARAIRFFGGGLDLTSLTRTGVEEWHAHLLNELEHSGGVGFSEGSAHKHLCSLGAVIEFGMREKVLPEGPNPVPHSKSRKVRYDITPYLEVHEMAEALRFLREEYRPTREDLAVPFAFEVIATAALTGARRASVLSLRVSDVDFDRNVVIIVRRSGRGRESKVPKSRIVPLFPQLRAILLAYLSGPHAPTGRLLFPAPGKDGGERPVKDLRKVLNRIELPPELAERARQLNGEGTKTYSSLSFTMLRHTYCTARLQTLDHGRPIAKHTVAAEMGHRSEAMIDRVYGHLGRIRYRSDHVEYRW